MTAVSQGRSANEAGTKEEVGTEDSDPHEPRPHQWRQAQESRHGSDEVAFHAHAHSHCKELRGDSVRKCLNCRVPTLASASGPSFLVNSQPTCHSLARGPLSGLGARLRASAMSGAICYSKPTSLTVAMGTVLIVGTLLSYVPWYPLPHPPSPSPSPRPHLALAICLVPCVSWCQQHTH